MFDNNINISLKLATTLDGKIALKNRDSKWITCEKSRQKVHDLRFSHDAVLTGSGTVLADNPSFNIRHLNNIKPEDMPKRIILDSALKTPKNANIINPQIGGPAIIFCDKDEFYDFKSDFDVQPTIIKVSKNHYGLNIAEIIEELAKLNIKNIMVEAGAHIAASFLNQNMIDKIYWFRAPKIIGGDGINVFEALGFNDMKQIIELKRIGLEEYDQDLLEIYKIIKV